MGIISDYINGYFPYLGMKFINIPLARKRWKGTDEELIFTGKKILKSNNKTPSIVFFSVHKAGSSISFRYLKKLALDNALVSMNYDGYVSSAATEKKYLYDDNDFLRRAFLDEGFFYGCFRSYLPIPNMEKYKIVLLLRDPRDVMVSYYFSMRYTNTIHHKRGVEARRRVKKITIDQYVIEILPRFKKVYEDYIDFLLNKPNVMFTKYEDLINDSKHWLLSVAEFCKLDVPLDLLQSIENNINPLPKKENKRKHLRKGIPGDYKEKLKQETIDQLSNTLKPILLKLGYEF